MKEVVFNHLKFRSEGRKECAFAGQNASVFAKKIMPHPTLVPKAKRLEPMLVLYLHEKKN